MILLKTRVEPGNELAEFKQPKIRAICIDHS